MRRRVSRVLVVCLLTSVAVHFTAGPLLVRLLGQYVAAWQEPEPTVHVTSSALRISHRTHPLPPRRAARPRIASRAEQVPLPAVAPPRLPVLHSESIPATTPAPSTSRQTSISASITKDEARFEKTIEQLRSQSDPVVSAVRSPLPAEAMRHYAFNVSADVASGPSQQGILEPLPGSPWHDGGYDYYYVRYWVEYADGTTETGIVPWPLRYPPSQDPFRLGLRHIPLPLPLSDYQLTPGTVMHPLVAFCYAHRAQLASCPIQHA